MSGTNLQLAASILYLSNTYARIKDLTDILHLKMFGSTPSKYKDQYCSLPPSKFISVIKGKFYIVQIPFFKYQGIVHQFTQQNVALTL